MGSVENAKLVNWRVAEGQTYKAGDVLYEIETDKTVTEVEAETDGLLASHIAHEGAELKVGDLVGWTAAAETSSTDAAHAVADKVAPSAQPAAAPRVSPRARRIARERGIELSQITNVSGRISGEDVVRTAGIATATLRATGEPTTLPVQLPGYADVPVDLIVNGSRRRAIARRLTESARTAPQLTADMQIDLTALMAVRADHNARLREKNHPASSILSYVAHATARLLMEHRALNAAYTDSHTFQWRCVNLGIAVDTPDGLVVPVIRNADDLTLEETNALIASMADRARRGVLRQEEVEGATFTISNPGAIGPVLRAEAILNPPAVALLGLPGIQYTPVALESEDFRIEVRPVLRPSLTFDHRALDGGQVIRFLSALKSALEQPASIER